jgi:hypothetical protein
MHAVLEYCILGSICILCVCCAVTLRLQQLLSVADSCGTALCGGACVMVLSNSYCCTLLCVCYGSWLISDAPAADPYLKLEAVFASPLQLQHSSSDSSSGSTGSSRSGTGSSSGNRGSHQRAVSNSNSRSVLIESTSRLFDSNVTTAGVDAAAAYSSNIYNSATAAAAASTTATEAATDADNNTDAGAVPEYSSTATTAADTTATYTGTAAAGDVTVTAAAAADAADVDTDTDIAVEFTVGASVNVTGLTDDGDWVLLHSTLAEDEWQVVKCYTDTTASTASSTTGKRNEGYKRGKHATAAASSATTAGTAAAGGAAVVCDSVTLLHVIFDAPGLIR